MAELIDRRDIVFAHKVEGSEEYKEGFLDGAMCVLNAVDEMPTIEAKPVVQAHWREFYPPKEFILTGEEKLYICSNCDAKYSNIENQRFCPWCGAQMDEVTLNE